MVPAMTDTSRYHHGDLRHALLQAGLSLLEEQGLDGLSLRAVAARAGVSHAGPAHHFATLKHLLTALAAIAFERFVAAMDDARGRAGPDPRSQLAATGDGYVTFATANPQLFRLMFSATRLDWSDAHLQETARAARQQLADVCEPVAALRGIATPGGREQLQLLVWSVVHGYAHLLLSGQLHDASCATRAPPRPDLESLLFGPP